MEWPSQLAASAFEVQLPGLLQDSLLLRNGYDCVELEAGMVVVGDLAQVELHNFNASAEARSLVKSPFYGPHPSAFVKENVDPLLEKLCFKNNRDLSLFSDLDIYMLDIDFPYFAERLSILSTFVHNQLPNG
ncbi:hypothetical protein OQA88_11809 [Cercophora sp. LCS_1]